MSGWPLYVNREILMFNGENVEIKEASVVTEKPLTVFLNHNELATLICSPGGLKELTVGFLLSEGLLKARSQIEDIRLREEDGLVWIETYEPIAQTDNFLRRHIASCCGKGRAGLYFINDARQLQPVKSDWLLPFKQIQVLMAELEQRAESFRLTGGVHSAVLADESGIIIHYDDIGRHNAVDKVLGYAFLNDLPTFNKCLLLSGRVASEILIKAARGNIPVILSRAAPTELTLELAEELNLCVVGFARGNRFSIYTHPEKILMD
ncbi:Formate dehydrogenase, subunit FdhD [Syntrophomonas zehnderi OL-4]|uniref:Sulfur carrier protein FdhD n=1 Tax=Syntrophomonas zehnderi OL-4 TaxID=690567 RepID=A0A0E4C966_9FIRM|nr:formate dehydrogenase accessory sulfurtransferase FdhD [Syntrophomonas zehnderi]CFX88232.1 Formate dehydrogenase, subunit FdhD [Syntrophomonas zehnderi OL-4]